MLLKKALLLLLPLALAACSAAETPTLVTSEVLDKLPRVENSTKSPCWQQEQIAAQNSFVDTIKQGKTVVYRAPCRIDKPQLKTS